MLLTRKPHIGPLNSVTIGEDRIEWVNHTRLLGVTIITGFPDHTKKYCTKNCKQAETLKEEFVFKSCPWPLDLYFKIILQSVTCRLIVWDVCAIVEQLELSGIASS